MNYREIIEQAGAEFVAVRGESVFFLDPVSGKSLSLYTLACRSLADVELALKSAHERNLEFEPWLVSTKVNG